MIALSNCGRMVHRHDHDRYLCALFAPGERREDLLALLAFNHELAKTRESVTEPMLGQIRLQWWRESIAGIYGGQIRRHEVIEPLAAAVVRNHLPRPGLDALIDAREADLAADPPKTLADLEAYAEATGGGLNDLALILLGAADEASRRAGRHVGVGWALTGLLRATSHLVRQRRLLIPQNLHEKYLINISEVMEFRDSRALSFAVAEIAELARERLRAARALRADVSRAAQPVLLAAGIADVYLRRLARAGYRVFEPRLAEPARLVGWRLAAHALIGRY
ncbi:MAG: squalene/phytoene synthase family protein [Alphaproteobacteria bacterium]|nr:squalene/phytoene synthase family protein [Alphaproteobacteria bacterium]